MNKSEIEFIKSFSDYYFDDIHNSIFIKDQNFLLRFHLDLMKDEKIKNILNKNPEEFYAEVNTVVISEFTNRNEFMQINNSLTTKLYNALNVYYSLYTQIPFYTIRVSDDENQSELLYEIILNKSESINIQGFYTTLNSSQITLESTSDISTKSINKWSQIKYSNQILIIQTNTKARRIGYLKFIMNLFEQSSYFPISYLAKKIELEASVVQESLIEYKENFKGDDKGLIKKTQSGISAQPYIDLLRELNIITQINTSYILTKQAKIYLVLNKERHHFESEYNIFKLDIIDKLFFLKQFLIRDPLYLWSILDIILICNKPLDSSTIKKLFVNYILNELERNNLFTNNNQLKRSISELKKRIKSWNKPIVYLEHIIEPRINWLLDLGLLEQTIENTNVKKYVLTCSGNKFMTVLLGVYESTLTKQQSINSYLDKNYFEVFNYIFELDKRKDILNIKKIEEYLLDAFKLFKTEAPNRIAATQAIEYVCYKSFIEDGVIVEFDELKNYLIKENNIFTLDWFNTENDGALYVKKENKLIMELTDLNLKENPFRTGPSLKPEDLLWAGFPELKEKIEQRIKFSIKTSPSRIVLNWGRYGSGKTHAANFYTKTSRITDLSTEIGCSETKRIKINLPRTSRDPVQSFLRSFLGQISLQNIQADFAALKELENEEFVNQILTASSNDSVITELYKLIIENDDPAEFSSLEAYLFGDSTKGTLGKLGLPSGLRDDEQIVNFISTYINCITYEKKLYPAFILWLDEFEDIDTLNKASQDRVTTFLRQLFDKTPNNFLLFLNFTPKTFYNIEDLSITLGEALTTRAKLRISFDQPTSDEARNYIKELINSFLITQNSEFGPFSSEAVNFILSHIGSLSVRKINEVFSFIIEMAMINEIASITPEFVQSIRDEIVYYED